MTLKSKKTVCILSAILFVVIAFTITFQAITRFPTIGIRTDEKSIEPGDKDYDNQHTKEIPAPRRHLLLYFLFPFPFG